MRILVTGASGFIGRHLIDTLLEHGHEITAVARDLQKAKQMPWFDRVKFLIHDVHSQEVVRLFEEGMPDAVAHLAWPNLPNYLDTVHIESNLPADARFLRQLIAVGVPKLLVTGTCLEYGMVNGPLHEAIEPNPTTPYAIAKNALRQFLEQISHNTQCQLQWTRLFYTFGAGQNPNSLLAKLDQSIKSGDTAFKMSRGEQLRDYLPVSKVASKLSEVLHSSYTGVINICSGQPISVRQLVEERLNQRGRRIELLLGHYHYTNYEPMAFWGDASLFDREITQKLNSKL